MINDEDIQALMEVLHGIDGTDLDIILHSPSGSPESTEAIVSYLRSRFKHFRVIVPQLAMSSATLLACSSNQIVLGKHSSLGPTDPQFIISTSFGSRQVAAQAILEQFDKATQECSDPVKLNAWIPMLQQYGPNLLFLCQAALVMTKDLAKTWLKKYLFYGEIDASVKAKKISRWLSNNKKFKSHSRHISRGQLEKKGLIIKHLEDDQEFQDLVLSVYHSTTHTFQGTQVVKIVENHMGKAFMKLEK